jgi:hypothetical protein
MLLTKADVCQYGREQGPAVPARAPDHEGERRGILARMDPRHSKGTSKASKPSTSKASTLSPLSSRMSVELPL